MSKLNANAQPFVATTATSASNATRLLRPNAQPAFVVVAAPRAELLYNPVYPSWIPIYIDDDEDERCLFVTFSSGSPLTKEEIYHHFYRKFGDDVVRVYVHKRLEWRVDPEFGKITFTTPALPEMILANRNVVKMWVNGKPIWLKPYVPRSQRRSMANRA